MNHLITTLLFLALTISAHASTGRYRLMWRSDPSTTMVIGWEQFSGNTAVVHYDTQDHGADLQAYTNQKTHDNQVSYKGMNNTFARLTGLTPNTVYYFVIADNEGQSARFSFRTIPDDPGERLSFVSGGDSRDSYTVRVNGNRMVAKLRPHAVFFGGDMTGIATSGQWQEWFDHWQETVGPDGRMTPIVVAEGNHENSGGDYNGSWTARLNLMFDVENPEIYYAMSFGGSLLRAVTLNSEISIAGDQTTWLNSELTANAANHTWNIAQYHKPIRPHVSSKSEGNGQYDNWATPFYNHGLDVVFECDAHTVKSTWPIRPSTEGGSQEGFIRDDANGTIYMGEGTWGAPLRAADDNKAWTRASGTFNQIKWFHIDECNMDIRTVKFDNVAEVGQLYDANRFDIPTGIDLWNTGEGTVVTIAKGCNITKPEIQLNSPSGTIIQSTPTEVTLAADASYQDGPIASVEFYYYDEVQTVLIATDATAPYSVQWTPPTEGNTYTVYAKAVAEDGKTGTSNSEQVVVDATPFAIPGVIQAEDYSVAAGVQIEATSDVGGGDNIGFIDPADFVQYTVDVATTGDYVLDLRIASVFAGELELLINGTSIQTITTIVTGDWQAWQNQSITVPLTAGVQVLKVQFNAGGYNINHLSFALFQQQSDPVISNVIRSPYTPNSTQSVTVTATVIDDISLSDVSLQWGLDQQNLDQTVTMTASADLYTGAIQAHEDGTNVYYRVVALDGDANNSASTIQQYEVSPGYPKSPRGGRLLVDYETQDLTFEGFGGSNWTKVANPASDDLNSSAFVGQTNKGVETWAGLYTPDSLETTIDFSTYYILKMKVYSPRVGTVLVKFEDQLGNAGTPYELQVNTTKVNEWEEISLDFSAAGDNIYNALALFFDFGTANTDVWYFDDISLEAPTVDCNGDPEGSAYVDECDVCVGGNSPFPENSCFPTSITYERSYGMQLYPNPTHDVLSLQTTIPGAVVITDSRGRVVHTSFVQGLETVDVSHWTAGVYLVEAEGEQQKLVIE